MTKNSRVFLLYVLCLGFPLSLAAQSAFVRAGGEAAPAAPSGIDDAGMPNVALAFIVKPTEQRIQATSVAENWDLRATPLKAAGGSRLLKSHVEIEWLHPTTLRPRGFDYEFLPGNRLIIRARFQNITPSEIFLQDIHFAVHPATDTDLIVSSTEPVVTDADVGDDGTLSPGEMTSVMQFEVVHKGVPFFYCVNTWAVVQKVQKAPCGPCQDCCIAQGQVSGFSVGSSVDVVVHSGELTYSNVDLEISGRGFNWRFARKYRSLLSYDGPFGTSPIGQNWELNYSRRLVEVNYRNLTRLSSHRPSAKIGDVLDLDGNSRADIYQRVADGSYTSDIGFYTELVKNPDGGFVERYPSGMQIFFARPGTDGIARMASMVDRNGNSMRFEYDAGGRLVRVIDTLGRPIDYTYDGDGLLVEVRDFFDRSLRLEYDANGDLVAFSSPSVTGTPNGNDFPDGKTTRYTYDTEHKMETVTAPNEVVSGGPPRLVATYDAQNRVQTLTAGGVNASGVPAGGTITYVYSSFTPGAGDPSTAISKTVATDRNGNVSEFLFDALGDGVRSRLLTRDVRPSEPDFFETVFTYNDDSERIDKAFPLGNNLETTYDQDNPVRFQQGNVIRTRRVPDFARGGDQTFIQTSSTYEPIYNRVRSVTEARGNDPAYLPQNGGANSPERYTTVYTFDYEESCDFAAIGTKNGRTAAEVQQLLADAGMCAAPLGDVNADGITGQINGNVIRVQYPSVRLLAGSNQAQVEGDTTQEIVELNSYNQFGQRVKAVDPEGNVDIYDYFPERDPDGDGTPNNPAGDSSTGGYLKQVTRDTESAPGRNSGTNPPPTNIRRLFKYDPVGNVTRVVDGRGIATDYVVNELDQVVQTMRAAAHDLLPPDLSNPPEPVELVDFQYLERTVYDSNDNVVLRQVEDRGNTSNTGGFVDYQHEYEILDNQIEMREEVSVEEVLITRYRYDGNENQVLVIHPEGNASAAVYDERDLLFQTTRGAESRPPEGRYSEDDPTTFDRHGGAGTVPSTMTYHYDLNRNLIETVDAADTDGSADNNSDLGGAGDRTRYVYDGFDRRTSGVDSVGDQSVYQYDPAGNLVRVSRFGPAGGASPTSDGSDVLPQPVSTGGIIETANLVNDNLLEASEGFYDELSRVFQTDRLLLLVPDRVSTRAEYDRNSRVTFRVTDDLDVYRTEYDGADRVIRTPDSALNNGAVTADDGSASSLNPALLDGNTVEYAYDDNHNLIERKETDKTAIADVAPEVFRTTYLYDSLDRLGTSVNNIGHSRDYRYDSRNNEVAMADASGPVEGNTRVIHRRGLGSDAVIAGVNSAGNVTRNFYDGLSRTVESETLLTASGEGDGEYIGADLEGRKIDPPDGFLDLSQSEDGRITIAQAWDDNSRLLARRDDDGNTTAYVYDNQDRRIVERFGLNVGFQSTAFAIMGGDSGAFRDIRRPATLSDPPVDTEPEGTEIRYTFDQDSNVVAMEDEAGNLFTNTFDALDRRTNLDVATAPGFVGTTNQSWQYDGLSRPTEAFDNNEPTDGGDDDVTVQYLYDSLSRKIEETQRIGPGAAKSIALSYDIDQAGAVWRPSSTTYPNGRVVLSTYDHLDRLVTRQDADQLTPIGRYEYIGNGRVATLTYQNGTRLTHIGQVDGQNADIGYDDLRRIVNHRWEGFEADTRLGSGEIVVGFGHAYADGAPGYDRMNNKLIEEKLHDPANSELYTYDSKYRSATFSRGLLNAGKTEIASLTSTPGVSQQQTWNLDGAENWTRNTYTTGGVTSTEERSHSDFNEIDEVTGTPFGGGSTGQYEYDDNGNLTIDGVRSYQWDALNRLRTVGRVADSSITSIATYVYDTGNRRLRKVVSNGGLDGNVPNGTTGYYYGGWRVLEERDESDRVVRQYVYGTYIDEPLVLDRNIDDDGSATEAGDDERLFYHSNTMYSVFGLTDTDRNVVEGYLFDPHGRAAVRADTGSDGELFTDDDVITVDRTSAKWNPYQFQGRRADPETDLMYYRNRYYDTTTGRFIQRDPMGIWYHGNGNGYEAFGNNSLNRLDPLGLQDGGEDETGRSGETQGLSLGELVKLFGYIFSYDEESIKREQCTSLLTITETNDPEDRLGKTQSLDVRYEWRETVSSPTWDSIRFYHAIYTTINEEETSGHRYSVATFGVGREFEKEWGTVRTELTATVGGNVLPNVQPGWHDFWGFSDRTFLDDPEYYKGSAAIEADTTVYLWGFGNFNTSLLAGGRFSTGVVPSEAHIEANAEFGGLSLVGGASLFRTGGDLEEWESPDLHGYFNAEFQSPVSFLGARTDFFYSANPGGTDDDDTFGIALTLGNP